MSVYFGESAMLMSDQSNEKGYFVSCTGCGDAGPFEAIKQDAVDGWNLRTKAKFMSAYNADTYIGKIYSKYGSEKVFNDEVPTPGQFKEIEKAIRMAEANAYSAGIHAAIVAIELIQ